jgi:succinoglycan biosynthesis protein ExoA
MSDPRTETVDDLPRLSVIVPCRNEELFISRCLDSILKNNYPPDLMEIIVVDGMSADGTSSIVSAYAEKYPFVTMLRNERQITPAGLNLGIETSRGEVICRIDAHARIAPDYLRRCVQSLLDTGADNVGGAMQTLPSNSSLSAKSIALCMSHWFGVGNSDFRTGAVEPVFTDTVFGGCYRKAVFARIGLFNERLPRTQDIEFNQRLRGSGGRILLDPAIKCAYFASPNLRSFATHNFHDGIWSILPLAYSNVIPVRWRHLAAFAFVTILVVLGLSGIWFIPLRLALFVLVGGYSAVSIAFSSQLAFKKKNIFYLCSMPAVFAIRHFAYGVGSLCGAVALGLNGSLRRILLRPAIDSSEPDHLA